MFFFMREIVTRLREGHEENRKSTKESTFFFMDIVRCANVLKQKPFARKISVYRKESAACEAASDGDPLTRKDYQVP
jgi:hypothetical protein